MNKILRYSFIALLAMIGMNVSAQDVTDALTWDKLLVTGNGNGYQDFSGKTITSNAVYAGNASSGSDSYIQLRTNNNNAGIVTTTSGGKLKSVTITFNSKTTDRSLEIYGKNEAYTAATDLYGDAKGTLLKVISAADESKTYTVEGNYAFVGIKSANGAVYVDKIEITWTAGGEGGDTWTVAGTAPLVDKSWDPADTSADMTSADGESFVYTKENITLEQGTEYKFKVVKNHAWDEAYPSSDYIVTVDETATYKIEITFNSKTKEVGFKSEKTGAPAEVAHNYSVIGTLVGNWDVDTEMTKGDGNIYKAVFTNVAAGNYEFKVRADKDWGISYPSSNYKLTVEKDGSIVTVTFNEETKTVEATVKAVEILTVAKALEIINALEDGKTTADEYIVKGFVTSITEISTKYGNATFVIADEKGGSIGLTVFRIKGIDGESITDENLLKVNDEVVVQGKLQKYVKNGEMTPELAQGGKIISITSSGDTPETQTLVWDFTKWSAATVAALKADAAASKISGWSDVEKAADAEAGADPTETSKDNCFWSVAEPNADGTLSANGEVIEELKGLVWNKAYTVKRSLAIAVNYPTALSDYAGPAYLWLGGGKNKIPCFTIPGVKAGSMITMEVESHKASDARGVELYTGVDADGLVDAATKIGDSFTPKTKEAHTWTIAADCDVIVYNTNGCHIYSLKVAPSSSGISTVKAQKTQNNAIYNLAGQKVGNDYKGIVIVNGRKFMQK